MDVENLLGYAGETGGNRGEETGETGGKMGKMGGKWSQPESLSKIDRKSVV